MRMPDIIAKKRDGGQLDQLEIRQLVIDYSNDLIPDYQMAAFLMAVFLQGMTYEETAAMTLAMAESGKLVDLSAIPGIKVDKHSTGGVADTTTLILAPLVAAAGVPVAKMSGRGLGFTGGTLDKLESIPGFCTTLTQREFSDNLKKHGVALTGQSADVAPADGKIYALRDVTATVESIPLIASSVMSKKIAAGADKILLDVKVGSGAFMKDLSAAVELAGTMVKIGEIVGRETKAVLTSMEEPLGFNIGNSLEVQEAIDVLSGQGKAALREVSLTLGAHMLNMAGRGKSLAAARKLLEKYLDDGTALRKFAEFINAQHGDPAIIEHRELLPQAACQQQVFGGVSGFIEKIDVAKLGYSAAVLGAGRTYKGQQIDLAAGIVMQCGIGDYIEPGRTIAVLYTNDPMKLSAAEQLLRQALTIGRAKIKRPQLILGVVDKDGYHNL